MSLNSKSKNKQYDKLIKEFEHLNYSMEYSCSEHEHCKDQFKFYNRCWLAIIDH